MAGMPRRSVMDGSQPIRAPGGRSRGHRPFPEVVQEQPRMARILAGSPPGPPEGLDRASMTVEHLGDDAPRRRSHRCRRHGRGYDSGMPRNDPHAIEPKWQQYWEREKTFRAVEKPGVPKRYVLDMFPYPSGEGLHVGHPEGYTATDMWCRYQRMRGFNVPHPMGYGVRTAGRAVRDPDRHASAPLD